LHKMTLKTTGQVEKFLLELSPASGFRAEQANFSERSSVLLPTLDTFEDISTVFSTHFCPGQKGRHLHQCFAIINLPLQERFRDVAPYTSCRVLLFFFFEQYRGVEVFLKTSGPFAHARGEWNMAGHWRRLVKGEWNLLFCNF
jgi:hypothetical protein